MRGFVLLVFLLATLLSSCKKSEFVVSRKDFSDISLPSMLGLEHYKLLDGYNSRDRVSFTYYDPDGRLYLVDNGKQVFLNKEAYEEFKKQGAVFYGNEYIRQGDYLFFTQVAKPGYEKYGILIRYDTKKGELKSWKFSKTKQITSPPKLVGDGRGKLLLVWVDESVSPKSFAYSLVEEYGEKFPEETIVHEKDRTTMEAVPLYLQERGFFVLYLSTSKQGSELRLRSVPEGKEVTLIKTGPENIIYSFVVSHNQKERKVVVAPLTENREKQDIYVYSESSLLEGKPEKSFNVKLLHKTYDLLGVLYVGGKTYLFAGFRPDGSLELKGYNISLPNRYNIYYSVDGGRFERLSQSEPAHMFTSTMPSLASQDKSILVAYIDSPFINRNVGLAYIQDGKIKAGAVSLEGPNVSTGYPQVLPLDKGLYRLMYPVYDNKKNRWFFRVVDLKGEGIYTKYKLPPASELKDALKKRTEEFAKCRKADNVDCFYEYFDLGYRTLVTKEQQKAMLSTLSIKMTDFKYEKVRYIEGTPFAVAEGYLSFRFTSDTIGGRVEVPKGYRGKDIKDKITHLWVYHNGTWYYVVETMFRAYSLTW